MSRIFELAKQVAECRNRVNTLGMENIAKNYEDKIIQDSRYNFALNALKNANKEYNDELQKLSTEELIALSKSV